MQTTFTRIRKETNKTYHTEIKTKIPKRDTARSAGYNWKRKHQHSNQSLTNCTQPPPCYRVVTVTGLYDSQHAKAYVEVGNLSACMTGLN